MAKKSFDARAARSLTEKATVNVDEYLEFIESAAKEGKSQLKIPLSQIGNTEQDPDLVIKALKTLGFKATHYDGSSDEGESFHVAW